jgi:hypothetical protein
MKSKTKKKTPEQDALTFLRWTLNLIEARGLRYVNEQFAMATFVMACSILAPDGSLEDTRSHNAILAASDFADEFAGPGPGVPVSVLRSSVAAIEAVLCERPAREPTKQAA